MKTVPAQAECGRFTWKWRPLSTWRELVHSRKLIKLSQHSMQQLVYRLLMICVRD